MIRQLSNVEKCMNCFTKSWVSPDTGYLYFTEDGYDLLGINLKEHRTDDEREFKTAILEYTCDAACHFRPYDSHKDNKRLHQYMRDSLNAYLGTHFNNAELEFIRTYLEIGKRHRTALEFFDSGFDMKWLIDHKNDYW